MAILSDSEETYVINALRFQADALARVAKGHSHAGTGHRDCRSHLRTRATELRALADRLEEGQRIHARNMSVLDSYGLPHS